MCSFDKKQYYTKKGIRAMQKTDLLWFVYVIMWDLVTSYFWLIYFSILQTCISEHFLSSFKSHENNEYTLS